MITWLLSPIAQWLGIGVTTLILLIILLVLIFKD